MSKTKQLGDGGADMLPETQIAATPAATSVAGLRRRPAGLLDAPVRRPKVWTADWVGARLVEGCHTIARLRISVGPRQHANGWPGYQSMTRAEITTLLNELQQSRKLEGFYAERNRVAIPPSKEAIGRAEEALSWPLKYLHDQQELAQLVTGWAAGFFRREEPPGPAREGLIIIAVGLDRDRAPMR